MPFVFVFACSGGNDLGPTRPSFTTGDASFRTQLHDAPTMAILNFSWRSHAIDALKLTIEIAGTAAPETGTFGDIAFVQQATPANLAVWSGNDVSLAWWRGRFGGKRATIGDESPTTICGRSGTRQEVSVPEERATASFQGSDGKIGHREHRVPPQVHVAAAGTTVAGVAFVASWIADADRREALRADEQHFFDSIKCT